jgi:hypothetical protein
VVEQGCLAGSKKAGEDGDGEFASFGIHRFMEFQQPQERGRSRQRRMR